jgi:hypothetical protein
MINEKVFFTNLKLFLLNFGFEMKEEDLKNYAILCYIPFEKSFIEDKDFIIAIRKIIKNYSKSDIKQRPSGAEFYDLIYKNLEDSDYKKAEIEYNKVIINQKFGIFESFDVITQYLLEKMGVINEDNKERFIKNYVYTKNNKKIENVQIFLIENKKKEKNNDKNKKINEAIKDLSDKLAGNY